MTDSQKLYLFAISNSLDTSLIIISKEEIDYLYKNKHIEKVYGEKTIEIINLDKPISLDGIGQLVVDYQLLFDKSNLGVAGKRGDPKAVRNKLTRFIKEYKIKDFNSILEATKLYIANTDPRFVMMSDYFIYKIREKTKDSEVSSLAVWIEELGNELTTENTWSLIV